MVLNEAFINCVIRVIMTSRVNNAIFYAYWWAVKINLEIKSSYQ